MRRRPIAVADSAATLAAFLTGGPLLLKTLLNRYLKRSASLRGRIGGVSINPFSGRISASEVSLVAFKDGASVASLHAVTADIDISLRDLAHGHVVARLDLIRPAVLWRVPPPEPAPRADAGTPATPYASSGARLDRVVRRLPPFRIDRIRVIDGEFHAQNVPGQNGSDLRLERVDVDIENFVTREDLAETTLARARITAHAMDSGRLEASLSADPLAIQPLFDATLRLDSLHLPEMGTVIRHNTGTDVEEGTLSLYAEAAGADGAVQGYVKPVIDHLRLHRPPEGNAWRTFAARLGARIARNLRRDRIATKITFRGPVENPKVGIPSAVRTLLRNAFRRPLLSGLDGGIAASRVAREVAHGTLLAAPTPPPAWTLPFRLLMDAFKTWSEEQGPRLGAALAYYTVFSLAPLILLAVAICGLVFGRAAAEGKIMESLAGVMGAASAQAIQGMVEAARRPATGLAASAIGLVTLVLGASAIVTELKTSLNRIWGATPHAGFLLAIRKKLLCFSAVLAIGFLMLVSLLVSAAVNVAATYVSGRLPVPAWALQSVNILATVVSIGALFAMLYKILPDTRVEWRDVWVGSLFATALFEIGKQALGLYLGKSVTTSAYGAAGSILLLLLWIYYSAQIFYLGAAFTRAYSERFGSRSQEEDWRSQVSQR